MPYIPPSSAPSSPTATTPAPSTTLNVAAGPATRRHGRHSFEPAVSFQRLSSSSYLHRHRRSPTICAPVSRLQQLEGQQHHHHQGQTQAQAQDVWTGGRGTLVLSPPESRNNSGDEEEGKQQQKTREMLDGLKEAMISIDKHHHQQQHNTEESASTGGGIIVYAVPEQATQTPDQSDQDEDEMAKKPPMLRKKSGELVRPAIRLRRGRPLSMPGTPTFSKAVHFGAQLEEVRHFMQLDRPLAVSAGSSPVEEYDGDTEFPFGSTSTTRDRDRDRNHWEARVTNFPSILDDARLNMPVRLRRVHLCPTTHALLGTVAVANLAYSKHVTARFTLDNWKTVSEVTGEFVPYNKTDVDREERVGFDTFSFSIELADQLRHGMENKTLFLCLRYNVGGNEFWDNNDDMNYQIVFGTQAMTPAAAGGCARDPLYRLRMARAGKGPGSKSRPRPLSMVAMSTSTSTNSGMGMSMTVKETQFEIKSEHHEVVDVDVDSEKESWFPDPDSPTRRNKIRTNVFGDRYDFSTSLSSTRMQALDNIPHSQQAQVESQVQARIQSEGNSDSDDSTRGVNAKRLSDFLSDRPNHQSQVYKELVDRYCFFGSTKGNTQQKGNSRVSSNDGTELELELDAEGDIDTSSSSSPDQSSTPTMQSMHMHLPRRLSPPPQNTSTSTSASTSDTEGVTTPSPSTGILPFPFPRERGMPASPAPTAILG
ncbi:uncharacterized protein GIQ15_02071 [Arthroderma uncinatum]|uniref:uncharacterized protein n=1 Tax=Arthroderma uncinatum TaxID=74035 RepID=UPI00144AC2C5|nr:uncharacterized protein GIQ15_02071 [Arthroderma uncinatum]KAF3482747.1 hypothetical protein GIQ15_02071 [Arthroderma uncinatum]